MLRSEAADKYLTHHYRLPINAAGKELHCRRQKFANICILILYDL